MKKIIFILLPGFLMALSALLIYFSACTYSPEEEKHVRAKEIAEDVYPDNPFGVVMAFCESLFLTAPEAGKKETADSMTGF